MEQLKLSSGERKLKNERSMKHEANIFHFMNCTMPVVRSGEVNKILQVDQNSMRMTLLLFNKKIFTNSQHKQ